MEFCNFLAKDRSVASESYQRWKVACSALCVHLSIGQVYAFSVFNKPLTKLLNTDQDWSLALVGWIFSIAIAFLGLSAAFGGVWLEKVGPRKTMFVAAMCFGGGFFISSIGIAAHQIWLMFLGYGVIGGIGLGLGYVSPVSTLIKWFPDRKGLATGLAIMGFGGGALIASPLSVQLMNAFASDNSNGVFETFLILGFLYTVLMTLGSFTIRVPQKDWTPSGFDKSASTTGSSKSYNLMNGKYVEVKSVLKTPQFYLLWLVLCMNVTAGIGVLGQASVMIQEVFKGQVSVVSAANFVLYLSVSNMIGRFFWSSISDYIGRKNLYFIFFILGAGLYSLIPLVGKAQNLELFILCYCLILSMYGGGFSGIPAYLADLYGVKNVGAIHGRLLTSWSVAGILGPVFVNYIRESQINQ